MGMLLAILAAICLLPVLKGEGWWIFPYWTMLVFTAMAIYASLEKMIIDIARQLAAYLLADRD